MAKNESIEIADLQKKKTQNKKRTRGPKHIKFLLFLLIFVLCIVGIMFSPVFAVTNINVTEMDRYTEGEICERLGVSKGENLFLFLLSGAKNKVKDDQYIEKIGFDIILPGTIDINIVERKVRGYVPFMGSYLYIDEYGTVLDIQQNYKTTLPIVEGLTFTEFKIGEPLKVDNQEAFEIIVTLSQLITKYNLLEDVVKIDVTDTSNIKASMKNIDVKLGSLEEADEKVRTMVAVMEEVGENDRGSLDLSDLSKPIVFQYLK